MWSCAPGTLRCHRCYWTTGGGVCHLWAPTAPIRRCSYGGGCSSQRLVAANLLLVFVLVVAVALAVVATLCLSPSIGLALSLRRLGDWGVSGATLRRLGALVRQDEERRNILDVVGGEFLQHLLIPYSLMKCNYHRSIGDTRNGIVNLREPLDEGAQGFPRALLDGMEVSLVARPSIRALKVGRELAAQL
jgi:hypothetical protein